MGCDCTVARVWAVQSQKRQPSKKRTQNTSVFLGGDFFGSPLLRPGSRIASFYWKHIGGTGQKWPIGLATSSGISHYYMCYLYTQIYNLYTNAYIYVYIYYHTVLNTPHTNAVTQHSRLPSLPSCYMAHRKGMRIYKIKNNEKECS